MTERAFRQLKAGDHIQLFSKETAIAIYIEDGCIPFDASRYELFQDDAVIFTISYSTGFAWVKLPDPQRIEVMRVPRVYVKQYLYSDYF